MKSAGNPLFSVAQREAAILAPYAFPSTASQGRKHPEAEHAYRGPFQRDRDRILHSSAFRRLSGKMQVFTGDRGDYHRTRLTHTHEVASIARTIGRALRLNEDLIEALALFHDLGHPPFGHAGEDALNDCLRDHGGFSHNRFALTVVEELEQRYASFPGLNLTREVLAGQLTRADKTPAGELKQTELAPLLEVQVVEAADSMTYDAHDTDDAVKLGLVTLDELAELPLVHSARQAVHESVGVQSPAIERKCVVHALIDRQVSDILQTAAEFLATRGQLSWLEMQKSTFRVQPSLSLAPAKRELETFLYSRVYRHPQLLDVRAQAQERLQKMFNQLCRQPSQLPPAYQRRAERVGIERAAGDYLAGMTDRFCDQEFERLCG